MVGGGDGRLHRHGPQTSRWRCGDIDCIIRVNFPRCIALLPRYRPRTSRSPTRSSPGIILKTVWTLADDVRTRKELFREYMIAKNPPLPIAARAANPDDASVLGHELSRGFLHRGLDTTHARSVLGEEIVDYALDAIDSSPGPGTETLSADSFGNALDDVKRVGGRVHPPSLVRGVERYTSKSTRWHPTCQARGVPSVRRPVDARSIDRDRCRTSAGSRVAAASGTRRRGRRPPELVIDQSEHIHDMDVITN